MARKQGLLPAAETMGSERESVVGSGSGSGSLGGSLGSVSAPGSRTATLRTVDSGIGSSNGEGESERTKSMGDMVPEPAVGGGVKSAAVDGREKNAFYS